jgi:ACS family glucarate transporter-like MFS transporter
MSFSHDEPADELQIARTAGRWNLVPLLLLMVAVSHFNRISITVAGAEVIIPQRGISPTEMGWIYSSFLIFYTLAMSPGGWFIDRYGAALGLLILALGSAIFMALTGLAGQFWTGATLLVSLLIVRSLMGITNVSTHPGAASFVGQWIPPRQQNFVNGLVNFAALMGISITYPLFGMMIDRFGWSDASFIAAGGTLCLALIWGLFAFKGPQVRPHPVAASPPSNGAPINPFAIQTGDPPAPGARPRSIGSLLNRSLLCLTASYAALGYFQYLFFYWAQYYFEEVRHLSKDDGRQFASGLAIAMGLGMVVGGWLTDWSRHRFPHPRTIALMPVVGLSGAAAALVPGIFSDSTLVTVCCFALAMAAAGTCEGAFWTLAVEIGGRRGGLAAAILNTGGNAGGLIAPVLTPYISEWLGWQAGLAFASAVCLIGALCWLGIDPRQRVRE